MLFSISATLEAKSVSVCETEICHKESNAIRSSLNASIAPCDDFYHFACGRYLQNATIPDNEHIVSKMSSLQDDLHKRLLQMLQEPIAKDEISPFKMSKTFFSSCINFGELFSV